MKDGSEGKMMSLFWLHWLHAPSLVSIDQSKLFIERKLNCYFNNSNLDLDYIHLGSNPKLRLDVSYPYIKFGQIPISGSREDVV